MTPEDQQAFDLVVELSEANRDFATPAQLFAIARRYLDERAAQEREQDQCFVTLVDRLYEDRLSRDVETGLMAECRARAAAIRALPPAQNHPEHAPDRAQRHPEQRDR